MSASAVRVFYDADADPTRLRDRVVAVIGYGSQGHAHALNLRDSGVRVIVGLRPGGASWERARAEGLDVRPIADAALADALAYAAGIGCTRAGVLETSFKEETETDLFGEQAVLCGGVTALVQAGFETLTNAGYAPEIAYFECLHELKLIVDLMYRGGMGFMRRSISDTAEYGDYTRGPKIVTDEVRAAMRRMLADIQSGSFAREWIGEARGGAARFQALRRAAAEHPIERVGAKLRAMMPWTEEGKAAASGPGLRAAAGRPGRERPRIRRGAVRPAITQPGHRARDRPRARAHPAGDDHRVRGLAHLDARSVRGPGRGDRHERGGARPRDAVPRLVRAAHHGGAPHRHGRTGRHGQGSHSRVDRLHRYRRCDRARHRIHRGRDPRALDGGADDGVQHVDRGGGAGAEDRL